MLSKNSIVVMTQEHVLSSVVDEEVVLLHLKQGNYYTLDGVGADIWRMLDQRIQVADIIERIAQTYDAPVKQIEADVFALLEDLALEGLIDVYDEDGQRQPIKRERCHAREARSRAA